MTDQAASMRAVEKALLSDERKDSTSIRSRLEEIEQLTNMLNQKIKSVQKLLNG